MLYSESRASSLLVNVRRDRGIQYSLMTIPLMQAESGSRTSGLGQTGKRCDLLTPAAVAARRHVLRCTARQQQQGATEKWRRIAV